MILRNRLYERQPPDRDATLFIIYCEGSKREPQYFKYFKGISSRIKLEVIEADSQGDNSPLGLYRCSCIDIESSETNPSTKYELAEGDQVWFVIDTDAWGEAISELRKKCAQRRDWHVAQSNPCFEVWLYYHVFSDNAGNMQLPDCNDWKNYINNNIPGGFNSTKHSIFIADAIANAQTHFSSNGEDVSYGSTEVFKLGKAIYPMVASIIEEARRMNNF